ncbi:MAG: hypothetical protein ABI461_21520 [Polyangiaceae bacterium]
MKRIAAVGLTISLVFSGFVSLLAAACTDTPTHIFYGQAYDGTRSCLESVSVVDTIGGDDTGQSCAPICIASPPGFEAGTTVYVSTTCPPYPPLFDTSGNDPQCAPALAAAKTQTTCLSDGGVVSTNPADAEVDASDDSGDVILDATSGDAL